MNHRVIHESWYGGAVDQTKPQKYMGNQACSNNYNAAVTPLECNVMNCAYSLKKTNFVSVVTVYSKWITKVFRVGLYRDMLVVYK